MADSQYDLCVIGGGIHGVGVAQAAAARGHSVLVLEKTALAAGTSRCSSKLIHGGLRYLESAQFSLVRECLRERATLLRIAPHLVRLQPFTIPIYRNTKRRPWQLRAGLSLYALLGGLREENRFTTIANKDWVALDNLRTDHLQCVFRYWDGHTDDLLLTRAVMSSAIHMGAELAMPATFLASRSNSNGIDVLYSKDGVEKTCKVAALCNAAGPWVVEVAKTIIPTMDLPAIELVQGTHIEVRGEISGGMYYLEAPQDGRAVFVMPWKGNILVGTTETPVAGRADAVQPLAAERNYLLTVLRHYFPNYRDQNDDIVISSFAGARVLPAGHGKVFSRPREIILIVDDVYKPRVVTLIGGKLTAYRATAERVLEKLAAALPVRKQSVDTRSLLLPAP